MPAQPVPMEVMTARAHNGKTLGKRDLVVNDVSLMPRVDAPAAPEGLGDRGALEWSKVWAAGRWLWPDQDYAWVEQVARAYDDLDAFRKSIAVEGLTVRGVRPGTIVANPLLAEVRRAEETIRKCLSILGFSPTDRARLKLTELKGASELQKLTNGAGNSSPNNVVNSYVENEW